MGLVRAAYSAGKPAYGVGPGNAPAYIERTANVKKAVRDIITGKTFDNGVLCSSENSVVTDQPIADDVKREFQAQGGYFMNAAEIDALASVLVTPQRLPNPALVGKSATFIARSGKGACRNPRLDRGTRRPRFPARSKSSPGPFLLRGGRLARGVNVVSRSSDMEGWGTRCRSTPGTMTSSFSSG
jgi:hypothetical protein